MIVVFPVFRFGGPIRKLVHLQILRAVAASLVVVDHSIGGLIQRGFPLQAYEKPSVEVGGLGVTSFFVLSGLIMVLQTSGWTGSGRNAGLFLYRRLTRIVPMYWIATAIQLGMLNLWKKVPNHWFGQLLLSMFFIPDFLGDDAKMGPILGQGWTLNYEMAFYVLFAVSLLLPLRFRLPVLVGIPLFGVALGIVGQLNLASGPVSERMCAFYASPIVLLFAIGSVLGWLVPRLSWLPRVHPLISPAFLLIVAAALVLLSAGRTGDISWLSIPIVFLCLMGSNDGEDRVGRVLVRLGDASYSTYLLHNLVIGYVIEYGLWWFPRVPRGFGWAVVLILASTVLSNLVGLGVYLLFERRLIGWFKSFRQVPHRLPDVVPVVTQ